MPCEDLLAYKICFLLFYHIGNCKIGISYRNELATGYLDRDTGLRIKGENSSDKIASNIDKEENRAKEKNS